MPGPRCECSPVNRPCSLALPAFWLACLIVSIGHYTLSLALYPPPPPLCLPEVRKPSWVGIWFLGTDTFHGWRRNKSLKRDPALGRHSINTYNTTPSLFLTVSLHSDLVFVFSFAPFSLYSSYSVTLKFFPQIKNLKTLNSYKKKTILICMLTLRTKHFYLCLCVI